MTGVSSPARLPAGTQIAALAEAAAERHGVRVEGYRDLHAWSVEDPAAFWGLVWEHFGVRTSSAPEAVLTDAPMPDHRWFPGARLNYVDQVAAHRALPGPAVVSLAEDGTRTELSWPDLLDRSAAFAATLRGLGVGPGDRVVGYLANSAEAVIAFLGCAWVGGVWAGCAPDYGASAAAGRLRQLAPRVLVAVTAHDWAGTTHDRREVVAELAASLGVDHVVAVERAGLPLDAAAVEVPVHAWADTVALRPDDVPVEQVDADHPLWVLFSSGTTGVPKGIVHGHAGVVAAHLALLRLQHDLGEGDTLFWYTTTNWMLWNIVVSALLVGATTVTYEGSPAHPGPERLWQVVADEGVTMFGTSPGHIALSEASGLHPGADLDLSRLEQVAATGAPVPAAHNAWVAAEVGAGVPLISTCGGTDVVSAFLGGAPGVAITPGEIAAPLLGVAAAAFDDAGTPVRGRVGELVVSRPYPSMPVRFWDDPDGSRYRAAYFDTFDGVWRQGDWATHTERGGFVIHGRSDSTLNRHGVRIGSSDLYEIVEREPEVAEALVVGVERPDGSYRMPMFLVAAPGHELDETTLERLRVLLRRDGSPRHVPDEMHVVEALPHTRTGKKLEVPIKRILQGARVAEAVLAGAIDRPDLLDAYRDLAVSWAGAQPPSTTTTTTRSTS